MVTRPFFQKAKMIRAISSLFFFFLLTSCVNKIQVDFMEINDGQEIPLPDGAGAHVPDEAANCASSGFTTSYVSNSASEPQGEFYINVSEDDKNCFYSFDVRGGGGGSAQTSSKGGHGGRNQFTIVPGESGQFIIVIGGGGADIPGDVGGGAGGGASSVIFDPIGSVSRDLAYNISVSAGGGGGGATVAINGGHGAGDGAGADGGDGGGAPANGTGGITTGANGSSCAGEIYCQGGRGGLIDGLFGFGIGSGSGASYTYGGGGGGGYGGGGAPRYGRSGGGGAGKVFSVSSPATIVNLTDDLTQLGGGSLGSDLGIRISEDGAVFLIVSDTAP